MEDERLTALWQSYTSGQMNYPVDLSIVHGFLTTAMMNAVDSQNVEFTKKGIAYVMLIVNFIAGIRVK